MTVKIVSRTSWGAKPWDGTPARVSPGQRAHFFVHYDGANPINYTGVQVPRTIERAHLNQGWSGVGYNFVVDQAGTIYEGRGWDLQGAHCPGFNVTGIGVQIAVGGDQEPSEAALASCRALYEAACERFGRTLSKKGHKDGFATLCPGKHLYAWVQAGMPAGDYEPAPDPGGSGSSGGRPSVSRERVTLGGLEYGYGAVGEHVTAVGKALVKRGFGKHYKSGPGPEWTDADTMNYADFQESFGFTGKDANGVPGEFTLKNLMGGKLPGKAKPKVPTFPGRQYFVLGAKNSYAKRLQTWLHEGDWGPRYTVGPSTEMTRKDLEKVKALQRHYLAELGPADGLTGPKTWQYAFEVAHGLRRK